MRLTGLDYLALILVVVGALNWGLIGLFRFNLVNALFGGVPAIESIVYILVGLAGIWTAVVVGRLGSGNRVTA